jgi:hypothetical protein
VWSVVLHRPKWDPSIHPVTLGGLPDVVLDSDDHCDLLGVDGRGTSVS